METIIGTIFFGWLGAVVGYLLFGTYDNIALVCGVIGLIGGYGYMRDKLDKERRAAEWLLYQSRQMNNTNKKE